MELDALWINCWKYTKILIPYLSNLDLGSKWENFPLKIACDVKIKNNQPTLYSPRKKTLHNELGKDLKNSLKSKIMVLIQI